VEYEDPPTAPDELTESELAAMAMRRSARVKHYNLPGGRGKAKPIEKRDRWVNWDARFDEWSALDQAIEMTRTEKIGLNTQASLENMRVSSLDNKKIDFSADPYAYMMRQPDEIPPPQKHPGRNPELTMKAGLDRRTIAEKAEEIAEHLKQGKKLAWIAVEYQIGYRVLLREAKKRGWKE